jgi:release factor glutamine methyltransferase
MKNSKELLQEVLAGIRLHGSRDESRSMAFILLESLLGLSKTDIMSGKAVHYPEETARTLQDAMKRVNRGEPVQYIVGEEYFFGRRFHVNPSVLIPRPETEDLIRRIVKYDEDLTASGSRPSLLKILDIGTGSGCIPVTLYHEIANADIFATDISSRALAVARDNAARLKARITFLKHDILNEKIPVNDLDAIVSNPPYVTEGEKNAMNANVVDHEPHLALFVSDRDPLLFYRHIVRKANASLKAGGLLAVEINERFGEAVSGLFREEGFTEVEIIKDLAGKHRIVSGYRTQ